MSTARTRRTLSLGAVALLALLGLAGCSASPAGYLAVSMDPAGRMLATVAVCGDQRLKSLTLTDETTGASATVRPAESPAFGATLILTGPVVNPRPEGLFDLLDRAHTYSLAGTAKESDSDDDAGNLAAVRFSLEDLAKEPKLRGELMITTSEDEDGKAVGVTKTDFIRHAQEACG